VIDHEHTVQKNGGVKPADGGVAEHERRPRGVASDDDLIARRLDLPWRHEHRDDSWMGEGQSHPADGKRRAKIECDGRLRPDGSAVRGRRRRAEVQKEKSPILTDYPRMMRGNSWGRDDHVVVGGASD
jgi:hypothetical protein